MLIIKRPRNRHADAANDFRLLRLHQFPADRLQNCPESSLCSSAPVLEISGFSFLLPCRVRHTSFDFRSANIQKDIFFLLHPASVPFHLFPCIFSVYMPIESHFFVLDLLPSCYNVITYSFLCCKRLSAILSAFAKLCENAIIRFMHLAQNAKNPLFPGFFIHSGQRIFLIFYLFQYIFQL